MVVDVTGEQVTALLPVSLQLLLLIRKLYLPGQSQGASRYINLSCTNVLDVPNIEDAIVCINSCWRIDSMSDIFEPISHRTHLISCNAQIKSEARSILKNVNDIFQSK